MSRHRHETGRFGEGRGDSPEVRLGESSSVTYWLEDAPPDLEKSDAFGTGPFVDRLVDVVEHANPPFTLSVSGSWGIGKSTVARALIDRLRKRGTSACLVDAWTEDVAHLRRTIALEVGTELRGGSPAARDDVAKLIDSSLRTSITETKPPEPELAIDDAFERLRKHPAAVIWLVASVLVVSFFVVWTSTWSADVSRGVSTLLGAILVLGVVQTGYLFRIRVATQSQAPAEEAVQMADRFREIVTASGQAAAVVRVLVVVDNLDRLPGDEALRALSEIRALVEVPGSRCVFLIPVDRRAFAGHIKSALADDVSAKDYLDKFFNLDLLLTQPEPLDLRGWALSQAQQIFAGLDEPEVASAVQVVASAARGSPRSVIRILNGVSTRLRLVDPHADPMPTLTQLAFIEGLVVQFPDLVGWLDQDARNLEVLRSDLATLFEPVAQLGAIRTAVGSTTWGSNDERFEALRTYLLTNGDIGAPADTISVALSLRDDRLWRGVSNSKLLREAMAIGDAAAFEAGIDVLPSDERTTALERSVEAVRRSGTTFVRDAVSGLLAISKAVSPNQILDARLFPLAVSTVIAADDANRARISPQLAVYLLGEDRVHPRLDELANRLPDAVVSTVPAGANHLGLVHALRLGATRLEPARLPLVQNALAQFDDATLQPLFDEPVVVGLIQGPVAAALVARLAATDLMAESLDEPVLVATRLAAFVKAGGSEETLLPVADTLAQQVASSSSALSDQAISILRQFTTALATSIGSSVDALETALETSETGDRAVLFDIAIRLSAQQPQRTRLSGTIDSWIGDASTTLSQVDWLLRRRGKALVRLGSSYPEVLVDRWVDSGVAGWASLLARLEDGAGRERLRVALTTSAIADAQFGARALDVVLELRADQPQLEGFVVDVSAWISGATEPRHIGDLGPALSASRDASTDIEPALGAIGTRIQGASESELPEFGVALRALDQEGTLAASPLVNLLAARISALSVSDPASAAWLVRKTHASNDSIRAVCRVVLSASVSVTDLVQVLAECLKPAKRSDHIRVALVERASATATAEDEARALLEEARKWKPPRKDARDEYRGNLTAVASRYPTLTDLVNDLQVD
jgi:hypothetical protein